MHILGLGMLELEYEYLPLMSVIMLHMCYS